MLWLIYSITTPTALNSLCNSRDMHMVLQPFWLFCWYNVHTNCDWSWWWAAHFDAHPTKRKCCPTCWLQESWNNSGVYTLIWRLFKVGLPNVDGRLKTNNNNLMGGPSSCTAHAPQWHTWPTYTTSLSLWHRLQMHTDVEYILWYHYYQSLNDDGWEDLSSSVCFSACWHPSSLSSPQQVLTTTLGYSPGIMGELNCIKSFPCWLCIQQAHACPHAHTHTRTHAHTHAHTHTHTHIPTHAMHSLISNTISLMDPTLLWWDHSAIKPSSSITHMCTLIISSSMPQYPIQYMHIFDLKE